MVTNSIDRKIPTDRHVEDYVLLVTRVADITTVIHGTM